MATSSPSIPPMTSDGKRMRMVWNLGDGDGDSSTYLVERSINILKGHPTWKVFMGNVPLPIIRGSKDEPPHYVYLDDKACYAVYLSKTYSHDDLKAFWPFDFSTQGNIKQSRKNRGRIAYLDASCEEVARGSLRGQKKWYEFSGDQATEEYRPIRPKRIRMEQQVAQEFADEDARVSRELDTQPSSQDSGTSKTSEPTRESAAALRSPSLNIDATYPPRCTLRKSEALIQITNNKYSPKASARTPGTTSIQNSDNFSPSSSIPQTISSALIRTDPAFSSGSPDLLFRYDTKANVRPVSLPPRSITGSPYGTTTPASASRSVPRPILGDLREAFGSISSSSAIRSVISKRTFPEPHHSPVLSGPSKSSAPMKQTFIQPLDVSSPDSSLTIPTPKRTQTAPCSSPIIHSKPFNFGSDEANDNDSKEIVDLASEDSGEMTLHENSKLLQLEAQLKTAKQDNESCGREVEALKIHNRVITRERDNFRKVIVMLLAGKDSQYVDLTNRVVAYHEYTDALDELNKHVQNMVDVAKKDIQPTMTLSEGLGSVLDRYEKFMYHEGMDEEWKALQQEARSRNEAEGSPSSQPRSPWHFS